MIHRTTPACLTRLQARDIIVIRACYMLGIWDASPQPVRVASLPHDVLAAAVASGARAAAAPAQPMDAAIAMAKAVTGVKPTATTPTAAQGDALAAPQRTVAAGREAGEDIMSRPTPPPAAHVPDTLLPGSLVAGGARLRGKQAGGAYLKP